MNKKLTVKDSFGDKLVFDKGDYDAKVSSDLLRVYSTHRLDSEGAKLEPFMVACFKDWEWFIFDERHEKNFACEEPLLDAKIKFQADLLMEKYP